MSAVRDAVLWSALHGLPRAMQRRGARQGDPLARLMTEPGIDPFGVYEQVRALGPLAGNARFSVTADHAVASEVLRSERFGTAASLRQFPRPVRSVMRACLDPWAIGPVDPPSLLALDPPDHTRLRRLMSRAFTARRVAGMEEAITATARALLEDLDGRREADLVASYAARLPVAVIGDLLGIPASEREPLLGWGNDAAQQLDSGLSWGDYRASVRSLREMHRWFEGHLQRLRARPGDDLLSQMLVTTRDLPPSEQPTDTELRMVGLLVLGAGFETTVNLIANAVAALDAHPDQLAFLQADPAGWPRAVEEVLRWDSPVQFTARTSLAPAVVAGRELPEGHVTLVLVGGVNRDPQVFADPARFDVRRANAGDHLAFSAGPHFCLGAGLARVEGAVALRELYARHPGLRVSGPGVRRRTRTLRGFDSLPVTLEPVEAAAQLVEGLARQDGQVECHHG